MITNIWEDSVGKLLFFLFKAMIVVDKNCSTQVQVQDIIQSTIPKMHRMKKSPERKIKDTLIYLHME